MSQITKNNSAHVEIHPHQDRQQTNQTPPLKFVNSYDENTPNFKSKVERVNLLSFLNFAYIFRLIFDCWKLDRKGQTLTEKHLITFPYKYRGEVLEAQYLKHLQQQKLKNPNKKPSTALAVSMTVKWRFLLIVFVQTLFGFLRVFTAWVMKRLIDCYMDPRYASTDSFWWAGILSGVLLLAFCFEHHWYHLATCLCAYLRGSIISMLYTKITRLSIAEITKISAGKLVNIAANDVNVFEIYGAYFPSVIAGWFILVAGTALLWIFFGVTCLIGIGYLVALTPIQAVIAFLSVKPRNEKNNFTDERVRKTSEALEGIRLLKMYTWEVKFQEIIDNLRKKDVRLMKKVLFLGDVVSRSLGWSSQYVAAFLMFMLYHVTGGELTVSKVFSAYFLLGFIRLYFSYFIPNAFNFFAEAKLLFKRLDDILDAPEMSDKIFDDPVNPDNAVEFEKFTSYWGLNQAQNLAESLKKTQDSQKENAQRKPALENLNLNIKKGSLNAVVGTVGTGKTSFLLSFTGEMPRSSGSLRYHGKIAYVEQEPTIFAGTFRESILFGKEFKEDFYHQIIKACNLESDLKLFPNGDMSMIGERGNNLSGGQKARLALARAVYADADIYLLDDPLSAVDAKVAKSIYNETILGLLKEKTVILVTHQVHFVKDVENIIVMEEGKIVGNGTFEQLQSQGIDVNKIFSLENSKTIPKQALETHIQPIEQDKKNVSEIEPVKLPEKTKQNVTKDGSENRLDDEEVTSDALLNLASSDDPYAGKVSLRTYGLLFKEVGFGFMSLIFVSYVLLEFGEVAFGRILGAWVSGEFDLGTSLGTLGSIAVYMLVMHYIKNSAYTFGFLGASRRYHKRMLAKVIRSPINFFDTNPVGRILNRFSNDIGVLDKFVPHVALDVFDIFALIITVFIALAILDPILLGPIALSIILVLIIMNFYYPSIKLTKSYDLMTRGPAFSLFSSSISGIAIIRTFRQGDYFKQKFTTSLYKNTKGSMNFIMASRSLGYCVDLLYILTSIGMIYITTARINLSEGLSSGAIAAFTVILILSLAGLFQHGIRQFCQTNVFMAAAARVQTYCELPAEAPLTLTKDNELVQKGWPEKGDIEFHKVYMKYRADTDFIIKNLNLLVDSGQKIGCVGRTGAGKSTIINLLFRLQEIDKREDHSDSYIKIDKINSQSIGLHLLRGNISIIPQTPFIFTGTVRQNVDPLGQFTDEQIWNVLEEVRLKEHVAKLGQKLETKMNNASAIFSVGQKQLICLARTILKPSKVLVLDEATANMDTETDNFIQQKVMEKFKDSTVFTIAHRLATIADYDKVLVLDKGQKMEFDDPYKLLVKSVGDDTLTNKDGHFGSMVTNTGPFASQRILNIAREAYEKKLTKNTQK